MRLLFFIFIWLGYGNTCPPGFIPFLDKKCFSIEYMNLKNVTDAEKDCNQRGGRLAIMHTEEEYIFVDKMTEANNTYAYWIGLTKNGNWAWNDESNLKYGIWESANTDDADRDSTHACMGRILAGTPTFMSVASNFLQPYACSADIIQGEADDGCPEGYEYASEFGKCYRIATEYPFNSYFMMAAHHCAVDGGQLVKIESPRENDYIHRKLSPHSHSYWIGYNKLIHFNWTWIDSTPATYTNWMADKGRHECAKIKPEDGKWKTSECEKVRPFICEAVPSSFDVELSMKSAYSMVSADSEPSVDEYEVTEGDILTPKSTTASLSALNDHNLKWPKAEVPVKISKDFDKEWMDFIHNAIAEIEQKTCVRFRPFKGTDISYVHIIKTNIHTCDSQIGRQGGPQLLRLGTHCKNNGNILHELMHTLGFIHEHNRPDRDEYITIMWDLIQENKKNQFNKRSYQDATFLGTPYSYDSIMHYHQGAFGWNQDDITIVPKWDITTTLGGDKLSPIDVLRINRHYCKAKPAPKKPMCRICPKCPINPVCPVQPQPKLSVQCDSGWTLFPEIGFCYKMLFNLDQPSAKKACEKHNALLASINSNKENKFISGLTKSGKKGDWRDGVWIGLERVEDKWIWSDGNEVIWTNWGYARPHMNKKHSCAILNPDEREMGHWEMEWDNPTCDVVVRGAICKKSAYL